MTLTCDRCQTTIEGARVAVTTEATDARGVAVIVAKRWHLCQACAEAVCADLGERSPWDDNDARSFLHADDAGFVQHAGGYPGL